MDLFLLALAFGPSLVWLYWLWSRDGFRREPLGLLLRLFLGGGLLSVVLTLVVVLSLGELALIPSEENAPFLSMLLGAALPEELFKMLPVFLFAWRAKSWNEPFDGIVYAGAVALGFQMIETFLYMSDAAEWGGALFQGLVRGATSGHMIYGIVMGYYLSRMKFATSAAARWQNFAMALALPVALHLSWNVAIVRGGSFIDGNIIVALFAWALSVSLWLAAFRYKRQAREASPHHPSAGTVRMAAVGCTSCGGGYPEAALYCQGCGRLVEVAR